MEHSQGPKSGKIFYIRLDKADGQLYTAGDQVRGKVILDSPDDEDVSNVSIKFVGRTRSEIFEFADSTNTGAAIKPGNAIHFQQARVLFYAQHKLRATRYEWEFSFEFPASTQPTSNLPVEDRVEWRSSSYFRSSSQSHPLPPTSEHLGMHYSGRNEYFLEAILQRNESGISGGISVFNASCLEDIEMLPYVLPNVVAPLPQEPLVVEDSTAHEIKSYFLDPTYRNKKLSLKEKSKSLLGTSSVPTFFFSPTFSAPSHIYLGEDVFINVGLQFYPERSTTPLVPDVEFQYVRISLMAESRARSQVTSSFPRHQEGSGEKAVVERSLKDLGVFVEASQYKKLVMFAFGRVTPTFATYNYVLQYHLLVGCLFKVADQTIKVEKRLPIQILPELQARLDYEHYALRGDTIGDFESLPSTANLPSYEEVLTTTPGRSTPGRSDASISSSTRVEEPGPPPSL